MKSYDKYIDELKHIQTEINEMDSNQQNSVLMNFLDSLNALYSAGDVNIGSINVILAAAIKRTSEFK